MIKLIYILPFALTAIFFQGQPIDKLDKVFLDLKYKEGARTLYDIIEKNPNFKIKATREIFLQRAEFYAKYIGKNDLYMDADSIELQVSADKHLFSMEGANNSTTIRVYYYLKDTTAVNLNYQRLSKVISNAIEANDPNWKNANEAPNGVYYLTEMVYPQIFLNKSYSKYNYLTIEYAHYDR